MDSLRQAAAALGSKVRRSEEMVLDVTRSSSVLSQRLLQAMRKVEVLRCLGLPLQQGELEFRSRVNELNRNLDKPTATLGDVKRTAEAYKLIRGQGGEGQQKLGE